MSKHIEGPWVTESTHKTSNGLDEVISNNKGSCVGWAYRKEDAKLIRAAPEMLEMLKECRETIANFPRSLGYDFTHLPKIDALITEIESE